MTGGFVCRHCNSWVDFDSYPPTLRKTYLLLKKGEICQMCLAKMLKALDHPVRRAIVEFVLSEGE